MVSEKLWQSTSVSIQCDKFSYPWVWHSRYFDWGYHSEKRPYRLPYYVLVNNTERIIGYSTVKIVWVSDWYLLLLLFSWDLTTNNTYYDILYWTMIIILYLIWMFLMCHFSSFFSQFSNQSCLVISITIFLSVKYFYEVYFPILIYINIGNNKIRIIDFGRRIDLHLLLVGQ